MLRQVPAHLSACSAAAAGSALEYQQDFSQTAVENGLGGHLQYRDDDGRERGIGENTIHQHLKQCVIEQVPGVVWHGSVLLLSFDVLYIEMSDTLEKTLIVHSAGCCEGERNRPLDDR